MIKGIRFQGSRSMLIITEVHKFKVQVQVRVRGMINNVKKQSLNFENETLCVSGDHRSLVCKNLCVCETVCVLLLVAETLSGCSR